MSEVLNQGRTQDFGKRGGAGGGGVWVTVNYQNALHYHAHAQLFVVKFGGP